MKISTNSWHYRLYSKEYGSQDTNLCSYTQRLALILFGRAMYYIIGWGVGSILMTATWPIIALLCLLHGFYPVKWSILENNFAKKYPPIRAFGKKLYPAHALTPLAFLALGSFFYQIVPATEWSWLGALAVTMLVVGFGTVMTHLSYEVAKEDLNKFPAEPERPAGTIKLVWEYAKAKKARVCPLVTFVDESQN